MKNILSKFTSDNKTAMGLLIFCGLFLVLDLFIFLPWQFGSLNSAFTKTSTLVKDLKTLEDDLTRMRKDKENKASLVENMQLKRIIREEEFSLVLQYISDTANKNNVTIIEMRPVAVVANTKTPASPVAAGIKASMRVVNLNVTGGYHQLGKFINSLENAETVFKIQEFMIRPEDNNYLIERAVITLATYVKN